MKAKIGLLERCYRALDKATGIDSHPKPIPDSDLRISVERLRDVLMKISGYDGFIVEDVDIIIEKVKLEI